MTIAACLAWYGESPEHLDRMVASLAGVADRLVYLNGRWEPFPELAHDDPAEQVLAVEAAAAAADLELEPVGVGLTFPNQAAGRNMLMRHAEAHGDWLLVIDADEWVIDCDRPALERALRATDLDVGLIMCTQYPRRSYRFPRAIRRIYRAAAGVGVEIAHNGYRARDGRWLHGDPAYVQLADAATFSDLLHLGHDVECRPTRRADARHEFYRARHTGHLENWLPTWRRERELRKAAHA